MELKYLAVKNPSLNGLIAYSAESGQSFRSKLDTFSQKISVKLIKIFHSLSLNLRIEDPVNSMR